MRLLSMNSGVNVKALYTTITARDPSAYSSLDDNSFFFMYPRYGELY